MKRIKVGDLVVSDVCPELIDLEKNWHKKSCWAQVHQVHGIRFDAANFCRFYGRIN